MNYEMKLAELTEELGYWNAQMDINKDLFARNYDVAVRTRLVTFNRLITLYTNKIKSSIRYYESQQTNMD